LEILVVAVKSRYGNVTLHYTALTDGGPGASSMFGLLTELGNLLFSDNSLKTDEYRATGIPTPIYNPHSWTRLGHLLSFDQPAPIGFSYCGNDDPNNITHPHSCDGIVWDDTLTAQNAHHAMIAFFNKFPLFYDVDLYLTGESYAGIYIPTLAREIVQSNINHTQPVISLKLRGFAVGDGCLGTETDICGVLNPESGFDVWNVIFLAGHGQIPMSTFSLVMNACYHPHRDGSNDFASMYLRTLQQDVTVDGTMSPMSCQDAMKIMDDQTGGVYAYG
jgi:serine carboxypeptidase-like clade I